MLAATVVAAWAGLAAGAASFPVWLACEATFLSFYLTGFAGRGLATSCRWSSVRSPAALAVGYAAITARSSCWRGFRRWGSSRISVSCVGSSLPCSSVCRPTACGWMQLDRRVGCSAGARGRLVWCQDSICPWRRTVERRSSSRGSTASSRCAHPNVSVAHGASSIQDIRIRRAGSALPLRRLFHAGFD